MSTLYSISVPRPTSTFVVRTDARGETQNKNIEMEKPGAVKLYFTKRSLSVSKTKKANPEGGASQSVERARLQETFVTNYTARETPSTTNPRLRLIEIIVKPKSEQKKDRHRLCSEVHQVLCDGVTPEGEESCQVLAEWLKTPLSLAATGRGEVLGDLCVEMLKVVEQRLDGKSRDVLSRYWKGTAPRLEDSDAHFKANVEKAVRALVNARDVVKALECSPASDPAPWCPASPYYSATAASVLQQRQHFCL